MTLHDAMTEACAAVQIKPPRSFKPGQWVQTDTFGRNGKGDGRVLVFDDEQGGIAWNWQTQEKHLFSIRGRGQGGQHRPPRRDPEKERQRERERQEIARTCEAIVKACEPAQHPYLAAKGFPDEHGLVIDKPGWAMPAGRLGERMRRALPETDGPMLIVPGRIGKAVTTVQFITPEGAKKNIIGGQMGGSAHRIAKGRETWVCEGIATALSVRAALRLLGRSATVLSAFSAQNVAKVAAGYGAVVAADNDKPVEAFEGLGTGEHYAIKSGCRWVMPPERGDFNDMHDAEGLRAVALKLREVPP